MWDSGFLGQSQDFGTFPEARESPWTVPKTQSLNTMGVISQSQRPKSLGQSQDFGTVPDARDSPGRLGLSQRLKSPNTMGVIS